MRILFIYLFPLLVWAQSDAAVEKAILAANAQVAQAAESRDAGRLFSFMVDTSKGSIIQDGVLSLTPAEARARVEPGLERGPGVKYRWKRQHVTVISPDVALLVSEGDSIIDTGTGTVTRPFVQTTVWVLRDGAWKILHAHQSTPRNL